MMAMMRITGLLPAQQLKSSYRHDSELPDHLNSVCMCLESPINALNGLYIIQCRMFMSVCSLLVRFKACKLCHIASLLNDLITGSK